MAGESRGKGASPGGDKSIDAGALGGGGVPGIQGLAPNRMGGMRSPMMEAANGGGAPGGSAAKKMEDSAQKAQQPAKPQGAGSGVSAIKGMSQAEYDPVTNATHISHVMFDKGRHSASKGMKVVAILAVIAVIGAFFAVPGLRRSTVRFVMGIKENVIGSVRYKGKPKKKPKAPGYRAGTEPVTQAKDPDPRPDPIARGNCKKIIQSSAEKANLRVEERVMIAECHLAMDSLPQAESALKPLEQKLVEMPEGALNGETTALTNADSFQTLTETYLRQGKTSEADLLLRRRCASWKQTNTCVAKVMILAEKKLPPSPGIEVMFATRGTLDAKAQARLWLAGAKLAISHGKTAAIDQRFAMALAAAPRDARSLRKAIYEAQAQDLYNRGEILALKRTVDRAMSDLRSLDKSALAKLTLYRDLANPRNKARTIKSLLSREEITYRVKGDLDLIDLLGPDSLRFGLEADFARLLKRTSSQFKGSRSEATGGTVKRIMVWEIRTMIAANDTEGALTKLMAYERNHGKDSFSHHMRGVIYVNSKGNDRYFVLAAQEFQAALRRGTSWESLYGLGAALSRAKKKEAVPAVIRDLDRVVSTKGQKYWAEMLKAEYYILTDNYAGAERILKDWVGKDSGLVTPRRLGIQLYTKQGNKTEADKEQMELDELARAEKFQGSREGFASPLGVMALAKRPLE